MRLCSSACRRPSRTGGPSATSARRSWPTARPEDFELGTVALRTASQRPAQRQAEVRRRQRRRRRRRSSCVSEETRRNLNAILEY